MEWISVKDEVPTKSGKYLVTETFEESLIIMFAEWDAERHSFINSAGDEFLDRTEEGKGFHDDVMNERLTAWMAIEPYDEEGVVADEN